MKNPKKFKAVDHIRTASYDANIERYGDNSNTCDCCGKPTAQKMWIHYTEQGKVVNVGTDDLPEGFKSQGCFPIGPECAKKYGMDFIF